MDIKTVFSLLATAIGMMAFFLYMRDIFSLKTKPHIYTWFIWILTQGIAVAGILKGGGGWGALNLIVGSVLIAVVFLFSLRYGTRNITKSDLTVLIIAIAAIFVWRVLNQAVFAVVMATAIDILGYVPSIRKSYEEPWSETLLFWAGFVISDIFALLSLGEYNLLTTTYLVAITAANMSMFLLCFFRRYSVKEPLRHQTHPSFPDFGIGEDGTFV